jgi:acyl-CoA reductase-like NAD-dependent aldehyde dehydrogenase
MRANTRVKPPEPRSLESPQRITDEQIRHAILSLKRAEQALSPWRRKSRKSRAKAASKLAKVIDEVLLIPRCAVAPMSAETVREIQSRMPRAVGRAAVLKAIQRRRARQVAP